MKKVPTKIYLQFVPEGDKPVDDYYDTDEVTWCEDKINKNDVEYLKSSLFNKIEKTLTEKDIIDFGFTKVDGEYEMQIGVDTDEKDGLIPMKILLGNSWANNVEFSLLLCEGQRLYLQVNSLEQLQVFINSINRYEPVW